MRRLVPIFLIAIIIACNSSNTVNKQTTVEKLVKHYLDSALNDPKSYESISFDSVKTEYQVYWVADKEGIAIDNKVGEYLDTSSMYSKKADDIRFELDKARQYQKFKDLAKVYDHKGDSVNKILLEKAKNFKGKANGYNIIHSYRAKNGFGALVINRNRFFIDSAMTKVLNVDTKPRL